MNESTAPKVVSSEFDETESLPYLSESEYATFKRPTPSVRSSSVSEATYGFKESGSVLSLFLYDNYSKVATTKAKPEGPRLIIPERRALSSLPTPPILNTSPSSSRVEFKISRRPSLLSPCSPQTEASDEFNSDEEDVEVDPELVAKHCMPRRQTTICRKPVQKEYLSFFLKTTPSLPTIKLKISHNSKRLCKFEVETCVKWEILSQELAKNLKTSVWIMKDCKLWTMNGFSITNHEEWLVCLADERGNASLFLDFR